MVATEPIEEKCPVTVKASIRDGLGIFAKRDIKKGERLCYFDGTDFPIDQIKSDTTFNLIRRWGEDYPVFRIGHRTPQNQWGVGQYINDACKPELQFIVDLAIHHLHKPVKLGDLEAELNSYERKSLAANMAQKGEDYWYFASRDINANEEIFIHYGKQYWECWFISGLCPHLYLDGTVYNVLRICIAILMDPKVFKNPSKRTDEGFEQLLEQLSLTKFFDRQWDATFSKAQLVSRPDGEKTPLRRAEAFEFFVYALVR